MFDETMISKIDQTIVPRKKKTLKDIIGLTKGEGDAVKSKKRIQNGYK